MVKEKPILFSAPMVRAILEGRKTQTRRIVKTHLHGAHGYDIAKDIQEITECPYGQPGDRLWVRESFGYWSPKIVKYRADLMCSDGDKREHYTPGRWRPSIHMPRWASRILLEITNVRVERLQEISHEDAELEGVQCDMSILTFREHFERLWELINGPGSWEANPWVWIVEFKRIKP